MKTSNTHQILILFIKLCRVRQAILQIIGTIVLRSPISWKGRIPYVSTKSGDSCPQAALPSSTLGKFIPFPVKYGVQIPYSYLKKYIPEIDSIKFYINPTLKDPLLLNEVSKIRQDLYALCQLYPLPSPDAQLKVHSIIFDILYHLKHSFSKEISPDEAGAASMKYMNRLGQIAAFIREHYMENLTLDEVAGYVNLNPDYFTRFFKKYMGMTFLEYLNSIRMENLFMDLMDTDLSIQQLLSIHGFTNYKLFMKMFRARYGTTPNELRKSSRQHGPGHAM